MLSEQEFNDIYRRKRKVVLSALEGTFRVRPEEKEDLAQEVWLRLWKSGRPHSNPERALFRIIRSVVIDRARRRATESAALERLNPPTAFETFPLDAMMRRELFAALLSLLPSPCQRAALEGMWAGISASLMSKALDIPASTSKARYGRTLTALRKKITARRCLP